jgi:hypothetical protein
MNKRTIFSIIGGLCIAISLIINTFRPFELEKHNSFVSGSLVGAGVALLILHFIKSRKTES